MAITPDAERKRRSRAHQSGDHSTCLPGYCPEVTPVKVEMPAGAGYAFGPGGQSLWDECGRGADLKPGIRRLLVEACRIADRLDRLDSALADPEARWLTVHAQPNEEAYRIIVDKVLAEARQQATVLGGLMARIYPTPVAKPATEQPEESPRADKPANVLDFGPLAARRG